MSVTFGLWDVILILGISLQATVLAYVANPRHKAVIMTLPIPCSLATMALGMGINITHIVGLIALLGYTHSVRILHQQMKVNILLAIVLSIGFYIALGVAGYHLLPRHDTAFWMAAILVLALGIWMHITRKPMHEAGQRSPLPLPIKLPAVMGVIFGLTIIKQMLGGFAATFPMVGSVASYEMRRCLNTNCQSQPLTMMIATPLMMTCKLTQDHLPLAAALALGWVASLAAMAIVIPGYLRQNAPPVIAPEPQL